MERYEAGPDVFPVLASFIEERLGMRYTFEDRALLYHKLEARVLDVANGSLLQYYYKLRYDDPAGEELAHLAAALAVGETYLFREPDALFFVVDEVVPRALAARGRARVWCAACATGEEAFSLAMLLEARGLLDRVTVVGTDVSPRFVARARTGTVAARSLARSPRQDLAAPYVTSRAKGRVAITPRITTRVAFEELNLVDESAVRAQPVADVILLRNVLIYFSQERVRRVVSSLLDRLRDDGPLLVGVSESLMRLPLPLECQEHGGVFYYTKAVLQ